MHFLSNHPSHLTRGYLAALASAAFLSTTSILIRYLTINYQIPALVLACWRDFFVSLTLLPILVIFRPLLLRINRRNLTYLLVYGFLLAIFNSIWTLSVTFNGAAVSTVLAYCSAGFTVILAWFFLKEQVGWGKVFVVFLSIIGCVLVSNALDIKAWSINSAGIFTGILSGLAYAIYTLMGRKASRNELNPWTTLFYTFAFAGVFLLLFNLLLSGKIQGTISKPIEMFWLGERYIGWFILFLLAAVPTLAGFGLYNVSLVDLPSGVVNIIATLETVFSAVIAYLFLKEMMTIIQVIGSLLILGGVIFLRIHEGRGKSGLKDSS